MRYFEILLLLSFFLIYAKAQDGGTGDEAFVDPAAEEAVLKAEPAVEEEPIAKEDVKRRLIPRPPFYHSFSVAVNSNGNSAFFLTCYCFTRLCYGESFMHVTCNCTI